MLASAFFWSIRWVTEPLLLVYKSQRNEQERAQSNQFSWLLNFLFFCSATKIDFKKSRMPLYSTGKQKMLNISKESTIKNISNLIGQFIPVFTQVVMASEPVLSRGRSSLFYSLSYQHAQLPHCHHPALLINVPEGTIWRTAHALVPGFSAIGSRHIEEKDTNTRRGEFWKRYRRKRD